MLFKCPTNFCVNLCSHSSHILPFESQLVQMLRYFCQQLVTTILVVALKSLLGCQILRSFYLQLSPILQNDVMKVAAVIHLEKKSNWPLCVAAEVADLCDVIVAVHRGGRGHFLRHAFLSA